MLNFFSWTIPKDASPKESVGRALRVQGVLQLMLGVAMAICSFAAVDIDRGNMHHFQAENRTAESYAILGLDGGAVVSSVWVRQLD